MNLADISEIDFEKGEGLVPVVVQEFSSLKVLTLAYANREAIQKTIETGYAYFYRRSFGKVMKKGITSGNVQEVVQMLTDCDKDSVVYLIRSMGPPCHTGESSCFHYQIRESPPRLL